MCGLVMDVYDTSPEASSTIRDDLRCGNFLLFMTVQLNVVIPDYRRDGIHAARIKLT